jgi:hypothetical protein
VKLPAGLAAIAVLALAPALLAGAAPAASGGWYPSMNRGLAGDDVSPHRGRCKPRPRGAWERQGRRIEPRPSPVHRRIPGHDR